MHLAPLRLSELSTIFQDRYGSPLLPEDDSGRDDAFVMAHHLARLAGDQRRNIALWMRSWAPWMRPTEVEQLIDAVLAKPRRWRADPIGKKINLRDVDRTRLGIKTIGAADVSKQQRAARRKAQKREDMKRRRTASGTKPRAEYEAQSIAQSKPWIAEGVSRATWYRRQRKFGRQTDRYGA
ncbi:hypothetical protein [Bradyrhizobium sp. SZCCHNS2015]|uniref:hypothetical protein n=1 Tax=Bradyrhizobium sp. SZCCHNS2015 TaxID=3057305 RepID=UPI0028EB5BD2|nr:hypothetical protein [Bradyrhizobium sp. SZCCHNS2015]